MESIFSLAGLAILAAIMAAFVNEGKLPAAGMMLVLAVGIIIFLLLLPQIASLIGSFRDLAEKSNFNNFYLSGILRVIGISYIAEFSAQICRDVGQGSLAMKVELAGKIGIMILAVPIMTSILQSVLKLLA